MDLAVKTSIMLLQWSALAEAAADDVPVDATFQAAHGRRVDLWHVRQLLCLRCSRASWMRSNARQLWQDIDRHHRQAEST